MQCRCIGKHTIWKQMYIGKYRYCLKDRFYTNTYLPNTYFALVSFVSRFAVTLIIVKRFGTRSLIHAWVTFTFVYICNINNNALASVDS